MSGLEEMALEILKNDGDFMSAQDVWRAVWAQMNHQEKARYLTGPEYRNGRKNAIVETAAAFHSLHRRGLVTLQNRINMISVEARYLSPLEQMARI